MCISVPRCAWCYAGSFLVPASPADRWAITNIFRPPWPLGFRCWCSARWHLSSSMPFTHRTTSPRVSGTLPAKCQPAVGSWLLTGGDPHLLEQVDCVINLGHDPEHIPHINVDRARLFLVEQIVGRHGVERAIEEKADELAPAVEGCRAGIAAGRIHRGEEIDRHVVQLRIKVGCWLASAEGFNRLELRLRSVEFTLAGRFLHDSLQRRLGQVKKAVPGFNTPHRAVGHAERPVGIRGNKAAAFGQKGLGVTRTKSVVGAKPLLSLFADGFL